MQWLATDKSVVQDKFPVCFTFYDAAQGRTDQPIKFLLHKYLSLKPTANERVCFDAYWQKFSRAKGDGSVFFINESAFSDLTNDRDYFIKTANRELIENEKFQSSLEKYSQERSIEKVVIRCPSTYAIQPEKYSEIAEFMIEKNMQFPIILKSGYANAHEILIVIKETKLQDACARLHIDGYPIMIQDLVPHNEIIYKVYYFCGLLFVDLRFSVPDDLSPFGELHGFSK